MPLRPPQDEMAVLVQLPSEPKREHKVVSTSAGIIMQVVSCSPSSSKHMDDKTVILRAEQIACKYVAETACCMRQPWARIQVDMHMICCQR